MHTIHLYDCIVYKQCPYRDTNIDSDQVYF